MKRHALIFAVGILLLALIAAWLLPNLGNNSAPERTETSRRLDSASGTERPMHDASEAVSRRSVTLPNDTAKAAATDKKQALLQQVANEQNVQINFYGKVVDQGNNPIVGVKVKMRVRHWDVSLVGPPNAQAQMISLEAETGIDGGFHFNQATGDSLSIEYLKKEDYELSDKTYLHSAPSNGSFDNPVIYKMWKKGTPANLVVFDKDTRIPYDGSPVVFDLLAGTKSTGELSIGDLRVTLRRDPQLRPLGSKEKYDWWASIEVLGGGAIKSEEEFMHQAPESGYEPSIKIRKLKTEANWSPNQKVSFYLKSREGQCYGRVTVDFRTDSSRETTGFTVTSALNPSGSRNLQP
jgi:hypothetical protein